MPALSEIANYTDDATLSSDAIIQSSDHNTHRTNVRDLFSDLLSYLSDLEQNFSSGSEPTDTDNGKIWYDSSGAVAKLRVASAWKEMLSAGNDFDNLTGDFTTGGKVIIDVDGTAVNADGSITFGAGNDFGLYWDGSNAVLDVASALTNTVHDFKLLHNTSGTPAAGIGIGLLFNQETSASNVESIAAIRAVTTDVTGGSEDTKLNIDLQIAGAALATTATFDLDGLNLASGDDYSIAGTSVLNATTLGSAVVTSSLTTVGALNSGSITSGFGAIDNGASNITTTGSISGGTLTDGTLSITSGALTGGTTANFSGTITGPSGTWDSGGITNTAAATFVIKDDGDDQRIAIQGGSAASPTNGAGVLVDGVDRGGAASGGDLVMFSGDNSGAQIQFLRSTGAVSSYMDNDGDWYLADSAVFIDRSLNRVAIGATSADTLLHLSSASPVLTITDTTTYSTEREAGAINFEGKDGAGVNRIYSQVKGIAPPSGTNNAGQLGLFTRKSGVLYERIRVDEDGNIGIGTGSPSKSLHISDSASVQLQLESTGSNARIYMLATGSSNTSGRYIGANSSGEIVIFSSNGSTQHLVLDNSGNLQLPSYGSGTLVTDASGNVTASSDRSLKTDIEDYTIGLKEVCSLRPRTYRWNKPSGNETKNIYAGFIAQEVETAGVNYAVYGDEGSKTLTDRAIIAALVNSVKELSSRAGCVCGDS